uniref:Uncharacterized protein n=1 Tax=Arundo donax TaxID=35708 RepID=A0A0A9AVV5_ARUDO
MAPTAPDRRSGRRRTTAKARFLFLWSVHSTFAAFSSAFVRRDKAFKPNRSGALLASERSPGLALLSTSC